MNGDTPVQSAPDSGTPNSPWQYKSNTTKAAEFSDIPAQAPRTWGDVPEVSWSASEFIDHNKSPLWYAALAGLTVVVIAAIFLFSRDAVSIIAVVIMAVLVGIVAKRKPRVMGYRLDGHGLSVGQRLYPYDDYKSFMINDEGPMVSIVLFPLKRFMPNVSVYFDIADEGEIIDVLSRYLPMEVRERDVADRLGRKIRF